MSSDLFPFDGSFFTDPFSPFSDSAIDILQEIPDILHENPIIESNSVDQIHQLQNLSLYQSNSSNGYPDFSSPEVKTEECQIPFSSAFDYSSSFGAHGYGDSESVVKMMHRSYSSNSFDGKPSFLFQPRFGSLMESPNFQTQFLSSPENSFSNGQIRRACSTGDLQNMKTTQTSHRLSSSPLGTERSFMEEANSKVGRYSAEERRERIHRYRAKRNQRNFNKTIKYACRKTLADNRPRIRGRFARNDEAGDIPKAATFSRYEDEDELWVEGFHEEDDRTVNGGPLFNCYGPTQFQYYGYS